MYIRVGVGSCRGVTRCTPTSIPNNTCFASRIVPTPPTPLPCHWQVRFASSMEQVVQAVVEDASANARTVGSHAAALSAHAAHITNLRTSLHAASSTFAALLSVPCPISAGTAHLPDLTSPGHGNGVNSGHQADKGVSDGGVGGEYSFGDAGANRGNRASRMDASQQADAVVAAPTGAAPKNGVPPASVQTAQIIPPHAPAASINLFPGLLGLDLDEPLTPQSMC